MKLHLLLILIECLRNTLFQLQGCWIRCISLKDFSMNSQWYDCEECWPMRKTKLILEKHTKIICSIRTLCNFREANKICVRRPCKPHSQKVLIKMLDLLRNILLVTLCIKLFKKVFFHVTPVAGKCIQDLYLYPKQSLSVSLLLKSFYNFCKNTTIWDI